MRTDDAYLYERPYFDQFYINDRKRDAMYLQEYRRIIAKRDFGNVLDFGCGVGGFLSLWDDRWTRYGIEPSEYAAEKARQNGITILADIEQVQNESMDVVVFRGTLQHINYPMRALAEAARVLKRGGLLVVLATPDADSLVYQTFGTLPALDAPRNWVVFGHRCLTNILARLGFGDIEVLHPYWGSPYADPPRDFLNFIKSLFFGYRKFAFPGNQMEIYAQKL